MNTYAYVNGNPIMYTDSLGLATDAEIAAAIQVIQNNSGLKPPTSVNSVPGLSDVFGRPIQGQTDYSNNVSISANLYGENGKPVDQFLTQPFLQTMAHEMYHANQSSFEKALSHGELHNAIDSFAETLSEQALQEYKDLLNANCK